MGKVCLQHRSTNFILHLQFLACLKHSLKVRKKKFYNPDSHMGRDNAVGIATCYELDSQGIESRWE
jgi:hypothetical protein